MGFKSILLLETPDEQSLRKYAAAYDVVGVAGVARSLPTAHIEQEIRPILERFARIDCRLFQYKICSTFDSSPAVGSYGPAIELGRELFGGAPFPIVPAQPDLGRYTVFGTHFAKYAQTAYRLDRHPTMSRHPSTPIDEADLRLHLARQSGATTALFPITALRSTKQSAALKKIVADQPSAIVFDAIENDDLVAIARLMETSYLHERIFALGSGGLSYGFGRNWGTGGTLPAIHAVEAIEKLLVLSGSAAPQTAMQIEWALANGWNGVRVDLNMLFTPDGDRRANVIANLIEAVSAAFSSSKQGAVLYSALGPQDVTAGFARPGLSTAQVLGEAFGTILRALVERHGLRRAIVAGGDTSSYAARALAARSLELLKMLVPAGPLCLVHSAEACVEGLQLMLKGGQIGDERFFETVRLGALLT